MSNPDTIPRFAIPFGVREFAAGLAALSAGRTPSPAGLRKLIGEKPFFWTSSGRQALWLILKALGLKSGSAVATPLYSDFSVGVAIRQAGFQPVFVDIDETTLTMDPASLLRVRSRVSAVVVVHLFGHVARMDQLLEVARGIPVVEDTAHAPLSFLNGGMAGSFGSACFYSFASTKYWPAGGGGLAVLNDAALVERMAEDARSLAPQGRMRGIGTLLAQAAKSGAFRRPFYRFFAGTPRAWAERYALLEPALDSRAIQPGQAAVASLQAARLPELVERQRRNSFRLLAALSHVTDVVLPEERPGTHCNYHLFPVLTADEAERDAVRAGMLRRHVDSSCIYFDVVERSRELGYRGECPVSEAAAKRMLTLPNYASLSSLDLDRVAEAFTAAVEAHRSGKRGLARGVSRRPGEYPVAAREGN